MDKSERLYRYISECFTTDVMCSIFLENYEYMNQTAFYADMLKKFDIIFEELFEMDKPDERIEDKLADLRRHFDKQAIDIIINRLFVYYSSIIDNKYWLQTKENADKARLQQNYLFMFQEKMEKITEFKALMEDKLKKKKSSAKFFLESMNNLRNCEEDIYQNVMTK